MQFRELLKWLLLLWMSLVIWAAFMYVPPADGFIGESSRIVFFHVPTAWVAVLAFLVSCVASVALPVAPRPEERHPGGGRGRSRPDVRGPRHRHRGGVRPDHVGRVLELGSRARPRSSSCC